MFATKETVDAMRDLNAAMRKWQTVTLPSGTQFTKLELAWGVAKGYDHLPEGGFRVAGGRKVYADEPEARQAVVRALRGQVKGWLRELDLLSD